MNRHGLLVGEGLDALIRTIGNDIVVDVQLLILSSRFVLVRGNLEAGLHRSSRVRRRMDDHSFIHILWNVLLHINTHPN